MKSYTYLNFFQKLYRQQGQKYAFTAETETEYARWKSAFREALCRTLGLDMLGQTVKTFCPEAGDRGKIRLEGSVREDGYIRRKYVYETLPEVYMPFYMLVPGDWEAGQKRPAAVAIPAHGANKDTVAGVLSCPQVVQKLERTPRESYGRSLVKKGYVVFCPDPPGYGERIEPVPGEDKVFLGAVEPDPLGSSCKNLSQTAEALGLSLTALIIWDLKRLVDFAETCEEVDRNEIGAVGFSGGGQYAMWLAAMDDRISRAAVSGYVHGYYDSMMDTHLCPCNYAPNLWRLGDISDICSLIAPRPLYVENGLKDVLNGKQGIEGPKSQVEKIRKAYAVFGKEDQVIHYIFDGPHMWWGECLDNGFFPSWD